jgi:hypothetical protein
MRLLHADSQKKGEKKATLTPFISILTHIFWITAVAASHRHPRKPGTVGDRRPDFVHQCS